MKINKKMIRVGMAMSLIITTILTSTLSVGATDLTGISSVHNKVFTSTGHQINNTVLTNYHATSITGLVGVSSQTEFEIAVGMTDTQISYGGRPVIYVSDSACGPSAINAIDIAAQTVGAQVGPIVELMMFRAADGYYLNLEETLTPIRFAAAIPSGLIETGREFAMVRLHSNGQASVLVDLDNDPNTLTFETDKFSVFAMIFAPIGTFEKNKSIIGTMDDAVDATIELENIVIPTSTDLTSTVQTNFHATVIANLVGASTEKEFEEAVGLTTMQMYNGGRPVIYVADSECGPNAINSFELAAKTVGAKVEVIIELMMFRHADGYYLNMEDLAKPVRFTAVIPEKLRADKRDFAMIRLHSDGQTTILEDLDINPNTITFESDQFSVFALVHGYEGCFDKEDVVVVE